MAKVHEIFIRKFWVVSGIKNSYSINIEKCMKNPRDRLIRTNLQIYLKKIKKYAPKEKKSEINKLEVWLLFLKIKPALIFKPN